MYREWNQFDRDKQMPTRTALNSPLKLATPPSQLGGNTAPSVRELLPLATRGLVPMFDADRQLFCHRLLRTENGIVREGWSPRYTIMTLLGLRELELGRMDSPFDTKAIYASFVRETNWIRGIGDLGLLIWLTAVFDPGQLGDIFSKFRCQTALDRYPDARSGRTMELAWFLAGLAHAVDTDPKQGRTLTDVALGTYRRLEKNQGESGFFGHLSTKSSVAGRLRGRIGSFADQVYPIYAISKFARALEVQDSLGRALKCADAICRAQGELGQWWWLYDSRSGRVSSRYPVYAVHQHGMAPMALFAVEEASGESFSPFVYRGLGWINRNELGVDMRDPGQNLIWRCILPEISQKKYWEIASNLMRSKNDDAPAGSLKVLYEQRPYEYGWLLYAFARKAEGEPVLSEQG
jgi:hypothetical protein